MTAGQDALGYVDDGQQRVVEDDDDGGVGDVVVYLDGFVAHAGECLERRTGALGAVLGHGLHVAALRQRGLCNQLGSGDGALAGARVPANLCELRHGALLPG